MAASPVPSPEQPQRVRGIQCSDCRSVSRTTYWALNERPVCAKCKQQYAERIQRATGPGAMTRVLVQGILAALGGAIITAIGISIFGMTRILFSVGVGFLIGSVIKRANGGWPGRKYQVLAVALTYFALGLGAFTPTLLSFGAAKRELQRATADSLAAARARAAAADSASDDDPDKPEAGATDELAAMADSMEAERSKPPVHKTPELEGAEKLARLPLYAIVGGAVLMMITMPILANLQYGIYAAGLGLLAFGFGMKKAWDLTEGGIELQLSGPFKVGEGPIAPSF
jgi:hypothetical protein